MQQKTGGDAGLGSYLVVARATVQAMLQGACGAPPRGRRGVAHLSQTRREPGRHRPQKRRHRHGLGDAKDKQAVGSDEALSPRGRRSALAGARCD